MTPADVARLIGARGETVTLRREGSPNVDVACKARVRGYAPSELVGDIIQGDREVVIGNAEILAASWPAPIKKHDRVIITTAGETKMSTVQAADPHKIGDDVAGWWLVVRG